VARQGLVAAQACGAASDDGAVTDYTTDRRAPVRYVWVLKSADVADGSNRDYTECEQQQAWPTTRQDAEQDLAVWAAQASDPLRWDDDGRPYLDLTMAGVEARDTLHLLELGPGETPWE